MPDVPRVPKKDTRFFHEVMAVVHEVFTPRGLEDEVKRVIQRGIKAKPEVVAALAYFLCRSRNTKTYAPLPIAAGKFLANLEEVEKAKEEYEKTSKESLCCAEVSRMTPTDLRDFCAETGFVN
jgi:hypothetical protein